MPKSEVRSLSDMQKEFSQSLRDMDGGQHYHAKDIFDDFLFMASTALRQAVHVFKRGRADQELESSLLVLKKRYKIPNDFGKAFGALAIGLELDNHDFLGEYYGAIEAGNARTGQFFTPSALSDLIARMTFTREIYDSCVAKGRRMTISEPAVGSGGMVISLIPLLKEWNAHPSTVYVDCTDVDMRCVRMAYIQLTLLGLPAVIRHGNTLSGETWDSWETLTLAMYPLRADSNPTKKPRKFTIKLSPMPARLRETEVLAPRLRE